MSIAPLASPASLEVAGDGQVEGGVGLRRVLGGQALEGLAGLRGLVVPGQGFEANALERPDEPLLGLRHLLQGARADLPRLGEIPYTKGLLRLIFQLFRVGAAADKEQQADHRSQKDGAARVHAGVPPSSGPRPDRGGRIPARGGAA